MTITYNEFDVPSKDEQSTREARWNIERAKMHVLDKTEWPRGAEADGKLYSLECSRTQSGEWDPTAGEFVWTDTEALGSNFALTKPELTPITGTYAEVAGYANKLNAMQATSAGGVHWIYTPALIEPEKVA